MSYEGMIWSTWGTGLLYTVHRLASTFLGFLFLVLCIWLAWLLADMEDTIGKTVYSGWKKRAERVLGNAGRVGLLWSHFLDQLMRIIVGDSSATSLLHFV
jgi:hypothetical protein